MPTMSAVEGRHPQRVAPAAVDHPPALDHQGDDGVEHREEDPGTHQTRQGFVAVCGQQVTDRIGASQHGFQRGGANQKCHQRDHFDGQHQRQ